MIDIEDAHLGGQYNSYEEQLRLARRRYNVVVVVVMSALIVVIALLLIN